MGVTCLILLQKTKEGVFRAGQPVVGIVKYKVDKPTKFASIDIRLRGKGKCSWSETDMDDNRTTYSNKEEYVNICKNLLIGQNVVTGTHECPFEFFLPANIPTSMKNSTCTIEYKVFVTFVKDNFFGTKCTYEAEVLVYGYVEPCSPEPLIFGLQKNLFSLGANSNIDIKAEIEKTFVTPGENIKVNLLIYNDTDVLITVKTEIVKHFTYVSSGKSTNIEKEVLKPTAVYSPNVKERSVFNALKLGCIIPTLPNLYSIQHTKILIGEYKVRVTAKIPFPHTNAVVEIPVVIGERREQLGAAVVGYGASSSRMNEIEDIGEEKAETAEDYFQKYDNRIKEYKEKMQFS
ncbi:hypothetical protein PYW07_002017 [Mythimna separata]|uniref:Arrestin C-terminal-like domain-containing protein n=1 Tax=Mythimna separata TaxID=271217 RepID=A0AAD7YNR8_MYTSE|nr:hypothetical protein PYW07_002017 [Mythimna separata]